MMLANDCPLNDAANRLGMSTYELLRLAETGQINVCFVHRWGTETVRFVREKNSTLEVIEKGVLLHFGNALVCPSHPDLSAIFRDGVAEITGGISYDSSSEDETEWLLWTNPRRVTAADLVVPQYEVEALRKAGDFHAWREGFEPVQVNAATDSDAALGRQIRVQRSEFAKRNAAEVNGAREEERERWRSEAERIQAGRMRKASKRKLAQLVKESLSLPDSPETIRKAL